MLSFLRYCPTVFESGCTTLPSNQPRKQMGGPVVLHLFQICWCWFFFFFFLMLAIPNQCTVVSHSYFNLQFPSHIWYGASFHVCHLDIFFGAVSVHLLLFKIGWFVFLLLGLSSLYILNTSPFIRYTFCKHFLPICDLSSRSLNDVFCVVEDIDFNEVWHRFGLCLWCSILKVMPNPRSPRFSPVLSSRSFIVLHIHLGLWLIWG